MRRSADPGPSVQQHEQQLTLAYVWVAEAMVAAVRQVGLSPAALREPPAERAALPIDRRAEEPDSWSLEQRVSA